MKNKLFLTLLSIFVSITYSHAQLSKTIDVTTPGTLSEYLGTDKTKVTELILTGSINDADFATIKQMSLLKVLDMSAVDIVNGTIPTSAFAGFKLDKIVLPVSLRVIKNNAFQNMTGTNLDFSNCINLEEIGSTAFLGFQSPSGILDFSNDIKLVRFRNNGNVNGTFTGYTGHVILPKNLLSLNNSYEFYGFTGSVELPPVLETLGRRVFMSAKLSKALTIPSTLKNIGESTFSYMTGINLDFSNCINLEEIGSTAFLGFQSPSGILDFSKCISLKIINKNAFDSSSVTSITLPASLTTIATNAFYNCTKLETLVSLNPTPPALSTNVFTGVNKTTCTLYVPKGSVELYRAAAQWKDFLIEEYNVSLINNLIFRKSTGDNLYQVKSSEKFEIEVYANLMGEVRLGLFESSNGTFVEDIVSSISNNTYTCQASTNLISGGYIIQPYIIEEGEKKVISRKAGSHIIDRLLITVKNNWDEFSLRSAKTELNNHILISTGQEGLMEIATGKTFKVLVRYTDQAAAIKIGLFDPISGVLVSDITKSVEGNIFTCKVPTALADAKYTLMPYQIIDGSNVYVERLTDRAFLVDRLPLFVTLGEDTKEPEIHTPETVDLIYTEDGGATVLSEYKGVRIGEYYWMNNNFTNPTDIPVTKKQIDYAHDTYGMFNKQSTSPDQRTYWDYLGEQMGISNPSEAQIENILLPEFQKYYGTYYTMNRDRINKLSYVRRFGSIKEKINGTLVGQDTVNHYWDGIRSVVKSKYWDLPTAADVLQLIGMCGHGTMPEVRQYLSFKEKEISVALVAPGMDWFYPNSIHFPTPTYPTDVFESSNTNKYGMNIVPNGFRWGVAKPSLTVKNEKGFVTLSNVAVDELVGAGLNQALTFPIIDKDKDGMNIESRIFTSFQLGDHPVISYGKYPSPDAIPMRWCRALSDEELGYKLYINQDMASVNYPASQMVIYAAMIGEQYTNRKRSGEELLLEKVRNGIVKKADISIIKLGLNEAAPSGYNELPRGYIRGFYVQYLLDNPTPRKTVADLIDIALVNPFLWIADTSVKTVESELRITKIETPEQSPVNIYPNPVSDILYLDTETTISEIQIYSTNGKTVLRQTNIGSSVNVGHLASGTYILRFQIGDKKYTHKLIKK